MQDALLSITGACGLLVISQLSPGPDLFFVLRTALSQGFRGGTAVAAGITMGFLIQTLIVCFFGLWVLEQSWCPLVLAAAGIWLVYLACRIAPACWRTRILNRRKHEAQADVEAALRVEKAPRISTRRLFLQGFLCNILNPKCMLFVSGICIRPLSMYGAAYSWFVPTLVVSLQAASMGGWMVWSGLLQYPPLRRSYSRYSYVVDGIFAMLLLLCGAALIVPALFAALNYIF